MASSIHLSWSLLSFFLIGYLSSSITTTTAAYYAPATPKPKATPKPAPAYKPKPKPKYVPAKPKYVPAKPKYAPAKPKYAPAKPTLTFKTGALKNAFATFYGDETASETMGGACGYGNLYNNGYGTATAALSTVLFKNGYSCGQCFQIRCVNSKWCYKGSPAITITSTNLCPPNWAQDSNNGGWCNPPREHFDLAKPSFMKIAEWKAGIVPITYRRVPCTRTGGLRLNFQGNGYWLLVYVMNVGGGGDIATMAVKGSKTNWITMSHNWGASYQAFSQLGGQSLSFKLTSYTNHETIIAMNVAPSNWQIGMTYRANVNFH